MLPVRNEEGFMKNFFSAVLFSLVCVGSLQAAEPPVAGGATLGASVAVVQQLAYGWSVKKTILGKSVYNDQNQKIGRVEDVIVAPDKSLSYAIISTGGFLGMA